MTTTVTSSSLSLKTCDIFISPEIRDFYEKHQDQDPIQNHLHILHIISSILESQTSILTSSQIKQITERLAHVQHSIERVESKVETNNLKRENDELNQREKIIADTRSILKSHLHESADHLRNIIERNADSSFEKTKNAILETSSSASERVEDKLSIMLRDNFAKTEDEFRKMLPAERATITETFATMYKSITDIIEQSCLAKKDNDFDFRQEIITLSKRLERDGEMFATFDAKFAQFSQNAHMTISQSINSMEDRLGSQIHGISDVTARTEQTQLKMSEKQEEHLNKYRSSSVKGQMSERHLLTVLTNMFPSAELEDTSHETSSGDFLLRRMSKPDILVENKDYKANVRKEEVGKFLNDLRIQRKHGIFLSQSSGISNKLNLETEIIDDKFIAVFVHNVDYQQVFIGCAIAIVDCIHDSILSKNNHHQKQRKRSRSSLRDDNDLADDHDNDIADDHDNNNDDDDDDDDDVKEVHKMVEKNTDFVISDETIAAINEEIQNIIRNKEDMLHTMTTFVKSMTAKINEINFLSLDSILRRDTLLLCSNCKLFQCMSSVQMRAHKETGGGCVAANKYECDICNAYSSTNQRVLFNHKRGCGNVGEITCDLCHVFKAKTKKGIQTHRGRCAKKMKTSLSSSSSSSSSS